MCFGSENKDHMELFLKRKKNKLQGDKSDYVYTKISIDLCIMKQSIKKDIIHWFQWFSKQINFEKFS